MFFIGLLRVTQAIQLKLSSFKYFVKDYFFQKPEAMFTCTNQTDQNQNNYR